MDEVYNSVSFTFVKCCTESSIGAKNFTTNACDGTMISVSKHFDNPGFFASIKICGTNGKKLSNVAILASKTKLNTLATVGQAL
jgi:hypothetical protein